MLSSLDFLGIDISAGEQKRVAIPDRYSQDSKHAARPVTEPAADLLLEMTFILTIALLGLVVGILVGLLGIGGGVVLVPAMVYLLHFDQHMAQGTSLFILLPPIGLGALRGYWKNQEVDLRAGIICAIGFTLGGYGGGRIAVPMPSQQLQAIFGFFLMLSAFLLWRKTRDRCHRGEGGGRKASKATRATLGSS